MIINHKTDIKKFYRKLKENDEVDICLVKSGFYNRPKEESKKKPSWLDKVNARVDQKTNNAEFQEQIEKRYNEDLFESEVKQSKTEPADDGTGFDWNEMCDQTNGLTDSMIRQKKDFFADGEHMTLRECFAEFGQFLTCNLCCRNARRGMRAGGGAMPQSEMAEGRGPLGPEPPMEEEDRCSEQEAFRRIKKEYMNVQEQPEESEQIIQEAKAESAPKNPEDSWCQVPETTTQEECTENLRSTCNKK